MSISAQLDSEQLYESGLVLLDGLIERLHPKIKQVQRVRDRLFRTQDHQFRELYVTASKIAIRYLNHLKRPAESVQRYYILVKDVSHIDSKTLRAELAWAGVEASRALRALERHAEANGLTSLLIELYQRDSAPDTQEALAWAAGECCETFSKLQQYDAATAAWTTFIESHPSVTPELEHVIAWAYAQKVFSLRKAERYEEAMKQCDALIARFDLSATKMSSGRLLGD